MLRTPFINNPINSQFFEQFHPWSQLPQEGLLVHLKGDTYEDGGTTCLQDSISHTPDTYEQPSPSGSAYYTNKVDGEWRYAIGRWPISTDPISETSSIHGSIYAARDNNHCVVIAPGTWTGTDVGPNGRVEAFGTDTTIRGPMPGDADYEIMSGDVVLDVSASATSGILLGTVRTGWTIGPNIRVTGVNNAGQYAINSAVAVTLDGVDVVDNVRNLQCVALEANRSRFGANSDADYTIANLSGNSVWNFCVFEDMAGPLTIGAQTLVFNNCIFTGCKTHAVANSTTNNCTVTFNNCIFTGNNMYSTAFQYVVRTRDAGTWTFNNCMLMNAPIGTEFADEPTRITTNNCITDDFNPKFSTQRRESRVHLHIDDTPNEDHFYDVADLAETYGFVMCFSAYKDGSESIDFEKLAGYINSGHEVCSHGVSQTFLGSLAAVDITKAGDTVTIVTDTSDSDSDNWTGTLTLASGPELDLMSSSYDTLGKIEVYLESLGAAVGIPTGQLNIQSTRSICLANVTAQSVNSKFTFQHDEDALYYLEMYETKGWLESEITPYIPGWECKSFIFPGGSAVEATTDYAIDTAGYSQARTAFMDAHSSTVEFNVAYAACQPGYQVSDVATDEAYYREFAGFFTGVQNNGQVMGIYGHGAGEISLAMWEVIFEALTDTNQTVSTFSDAMDWVRSNSDHNTGYYYYACSDDNSLCFSQSTPYQLESDSPLIDAGTDPFSDGDGDQYDKDGYKVWDDTYDTTDGYWLHGVDVGPYSAVGSVPYGYHFEITGGTSWTNYTIEAPLAPELMAVDDGTFFTGGSANEIDATDRAGMTGDQIYFATNRGLAVYDADLTGDDLAAADKYFGVT